LNLMSPPPLCSLPEVLIISAGPRMSSWVGDTLSLDGCAVYYATIDQLPEAATKRPQLDVIILEHADASADALVRGCEAALELPLRVALLVVCSDLRLQLMAFKAGTDDCISDASDAAMLLERVLMNARRARALRASAPAKRVIRTPAGTLAVTLGPLIMLDGVPLDLPRVQIRLLRKLMEASHPVSVGELADSVWPGELVAVHTVHTQIALLRSRLEGLGIKVDHIRREGYVLSLWQRKEA
jgi:DNA-binding response OmpR family regulator